MEKKICKICNKEIESDVLYKGDYDQINISVLWPGDNLDLDGHKICLENINKLIVIPNRIKVEPFMEEYLRKQ
jgi:hypothetical protein